MLYVPECFHGLKILKSDHIGIEISTIGPNDYIEADTKIRPYWD